MFRFTEGNSKPTNVPAAEILKIPAVPPLLPAAEIGNRVR